MAAGPCLEVPLWDSVGATAYSGITGLCGDAWGHGTPRQRRRRGGGLLAIASFSRRRLPVSMPGADSLSSPPARAPGMACRLLGKRCRLDPKARGRGGGGAGSPGLSPPPLAFLLLLLRDLPRRGGGMGGGPGADPPMPPHGLSRSHIGATGRALPVDHASPPPPPSSPSVASPPEHAMVSVHCGTSIASGWSKYSPEESRDYEERRLEGRGEM